MFTAAWYLYNHVIQVVLTSDDSSNPVYEKSTLTSVAISSLYEVDYYGNRLMYSYSDINLKEYRSAIKKLNSDIDTLHSVMSSETQQVTLDEISRLLKKKEKNIKEITSLYKKHSSEVFFQESFDKVIEETAKDTVIKQSFFKRIGKAFTRAQKMDTVSQRSELVSAIELVKTDVAVKRAQSNAIIENKMQSIVLTEQMISGQISLLINELNREATDNSFHEINVKRALLHDSGRVIVIVGVVAVGVIILFLWIILMDVNKSQRYKRELEAARKRAEELMKSRQRLLFNISHDIKAPLCSITGYLDLIKEKEYAQSMKLSVDHIMDLLSNLLEYARMDTGKAVVNKSVFNIDEMVDAIHRIFIPLATEKKIALKINKNVSGVRYIDGDAVRIRQIIMNLMSNAVKFTDSGEVVLSYEVTYDQLHITVSDSGCGIEQDKQKVIFEEFTRVDEQCEGTGLGLAVVASAVELLGGTISLNSRVGQGSSFSVTLPVKRSVSQNELLLSKPLTVLMIDDDCLQLKMCEEMLRKIGHNIFTVSTMNELMQQLEQHNIDVVLTDINMGVLSGYDVARKIRDKGFLIPIIAVSAKESVEGDDFSNYLKKPFTLYELKQVLSLKIDITSLREMMGDDKQAVDEIVDMFVVSVKENFTIIEKCYRNREFAEIKKLCHKMLPMFMQFKINDIALLLREIDKSPEIDIRKVLKLIYKLGLFSRL